MAVMEVQVRIPFFTNLPRDVIMNRIHVVTAEPGGPDKDSVAATMATRLKTFYDTVYGVVNSAANYVSWGSAVVRVFDLSEPGPRIPATRPLVIAPNTAALATMPTEVAVVMSYRSALISGVVPQRLYNRIYLGGLTSGTLTGGGPAAFATVSTAFRTAIANAAIALEAANTSDVAWIQYSPTDATPRTIAAGFINNEFDTQRRRGVVESARTLIAF